MSWRESSGKQEVRWPGKPVRQAVADLRPKAMERVSPTELRKSIPGRGKSKVQRCRERGWRMQLRNREGPGLKKLAGAGSL